MSVHPEGGKDEAYKDSLCSMRESVEVDEIFDLTRETKKGRRHDIFEIVCESLHVIARLLLQSCSHPVHS